MGAAFEEHDEDMAAGVPDIGILKKRLASKRRRRRILRTVVLVPLCAALGWFFVIDPVIGIIEKHAAEKAARAEIEANAVHACITSESVPITAMSNGTTTEGSGLGALGAYAMRVGEDQTIAYVELLPDGGHLLRRIDAEGVVVYEIGPEDADQEPRLEEQSCAPRVATGTPGRDWVDAHLPYGDGFIERPVERTALYVPDGSVADTFSLDPAS